mgnify:CR=1 FL=1
MTHNIKTKIFKSITILLFILFLSYHSKSQTLVISNQNDTIVPINQINYGMDKIVNNYYFNLGANLDFKLFDGNAKIFQNYRGTALKTNSIAFRDDQNFSFKYLYPVSNSLNIAASQNWLFSSDTRSIGINELERLNGKIGLNYNFHTNSYLEVLFGAESNSQVGVKSPGLIINFDGTLNPINIFDLNLTANLQGEYLSLNYDRKNYNSDFKTTLTKIYDPNNGIFVNLKYKLQNRDFLTNINLQQIPTNIESRFENRIMPTLALDFLLVKNLFSSFQVSLSDVVINREFRNEIQDYSLSKVRKKLHEFNLSLNTIFKYEIDDFSQKIGLAFDVRNEENIIQKKFDITEQEEQSLKSIEHQRDNSSTKTTFAAKTEWIPLRNDSLTFDYSVSLFQYDTPSNLNYDDRDEFSNIVGLSYYHKFSPEFSAKLSSEIQLRHLVFLKSQRSSLNNWNRIIRLSPEFFYRLNGNFYNPKFEILANYTIYDFESQNSGVKSFSLRQISYKDTAFIKLSGCINLQSSIILRYYERGILYWDSFSEYPQNSNTELFLKFLIFTFTNNENSFGCGIRYYYIAQNSLRKGGLVYNTANFNQVSYGPEAVAILKISPNLKLFIQGWYETQIYNNIDYKYVPNLVFQTFYNL